MLSSLFLLLSLASISHAWKWSKGKKSGLFCFLKEQWKEWWQERGFAVAGEGGQVPQTKSSKSVLIWLSHIFQWCNITGPLASLHSLCVYKRTKAQCESNCSTTGHKCLDSTWGKRSEIEYEGLNFARLLLLLSLSFWGQELWHRNNIKQPFTAAKTSQSICPKVKPITGNCLNCLHLASSSNKASL